LPHKIDSLVDTLGDGLLSEQGRAAPLGMLERTPVPRPLPGKPSTRSALQRRPSWTSNSASVLHLRSTDSRKKYIDRSPIPNLRLYQHPGFNAAFVLQIPDALFEEAEKTNPDRDQAIFSQFSQPEKENLMKHFLAAASLDKFKYEAWLVEFRELEGKPMIKGEAGRTFWIWRSPA
jgi:hypothetical protein